MRQGGAGLPRPFTRPHEGSRSPGYSRRRAWPNRPEAAALLAAIANPPGAFDAIVVGEYECAFFGDQLILMMPKFQQHRVQLWLPELDGPVDFDDPAHLAVIRLLEA
jgi:hypothetical protein